MSLLAPALLLGLLGLAGPIVAHLLGRQRPREISLATMRFLPKAEPAVTHRRALEDVPLLVVRLLLLALLVLALARPATYDRSGMSMVAEVHDAVVLVDGSGSMGLQVQGQPLLQHAADRAEQLLDSLPAGTRVGLVTSDPTGPKLAPTADPERVRQALREWLTRGAPSPGAWPLVDTLPTASNMLQELGGPNKKVVYAIGDATGTGLGSLPPLAQGETMVIRIPALSEPATSPEHVGIVAASWEPAPELDPRALRIKAVVHRYAGSADSTSSQQTLEASVGLYIGDTEVARTVVALEVDRDTPVEFTHTLLDQDDIVAASVALIDRPNDALPADDRRALWLSAEEGLEVAVVNGDPSELRVHDEVYFLTTAVAAANADRRIRVRSLASDQLEASVAKKGASALANVDVLVLCNVRAPSAALAPAIVQRVQQGMGLWITVGDRVQPEGYNKRLGALLPLRMRGAVVVGTAPGRTEARVESVGAADLSHPAFRGLSGEPGLGGARARRIMLLEPDPRQDVRIALSFSSGAPALLTHPFGDGQVALLTTTIDRDWADLPLRPGFVPLVNGTLNYLGGTGNGMTGTQIPVGATKRFRSEGLVVVSTPGGAKVSLAPTEGFVTFNDTFVPGHYQARLNADVKSVFTVEVEASESATTPVALDQAETLEGGGQVAVAVPRWRWLILLAAALLALESGIRVRRRLR